MKQGNFFKVRNIFSTAGLILSCSLVLSGCANVPASSVSPTNTKTKSVSVDSKTSTHIASPSSSPSQFSMKADPIDISCEQALSLQSLYDFDPNLALTPNHKTSLGSTGAQQEALGAISCLLTNLSSQEEFQVVITKLDAASEKHQVSVISNPMTGDTTYQVSSGVPGLFSIADSVGTAQFMTGKYWVSIASKTLANGIQASQLSYLIWNNIG